jgi:hypothetical protein
MATYTITRVMTRPDTDTKWPQELTDLRFDSDITISRTGVLSDDELTSTMEVVYSSKEDYTNIIINKNDDIFANKSAARRTYMSANNMTCRVTEEDGTVRVFNKSNDTFEVE